jgi:hypothetical protein
MPLHAPLHLCRRHCISVAHGSIPYYNFEAVQKVLTTSEYQWHKHKKKLEAAPFRTASTD